MGDSPRRLGCLEACDGNPNVGDYPLYATWHMALEHALLVALSEEPAAGSDLARRFDRSIGFFWSATHQQIYRTLARMTTDGWLSVTTVAQAGTPARRVYDVSPAGRRQLTRWLAAPTPVDPLRSELAVKLRAASRGDTTALRGIVKEHLADHTVRDYLAGRTPTEATR